MKKYLCLLLIYLINTNKIDIESTAVCLGDSWGSNDC